MLAFSYGFFVNGGFPSQRVSNTKNVSIMMASSDKQTMPITKFSVSAKLYELWDFNWTAVPEQFLCI